MWWGWLGGAGFLGDVGRIELPYHFTENFGCAWGVSDIWGKAQAHLCHSDDGLLYSYGPGRVSLSPDA